MDTPIYDFICELRKKQTSRFFMPGHKGIGWKSHPLATVFPMDITEILGADELFNADGIIRCSEQNASRLFGSKETVYSAGGSTLSIQAMVLLASRKGKRILAGRNAHMAFIHSCILLGVEPIWIVPNQTDRYGICGMISPEQVELELSRTSGIGAVYVTSPDYLGNTADLAGIHEVCQKYGVWMLVDNAHGAYLKWGGDHAHPLETGATLCCDSAHKTLPVLTGGGYLHAGKEFDGTAQDLKDAMHLFGSSSPSYLILESLDLCNRYLSQQAKEDFGSLKVRMKILRDRLRGRGIDFLSGETDFAKLTLEAESLGMDGWKLADVLRQNHIEPEYVNERYVVCLASPMNSEEDWERLERCLTNCQANGLSQLHTEYETYELPVRKLSSREAFQSDWEIISVEDCEGRIAAETIASCPPGVPVIVPGEVFTKKIKNICKNGGNFSIKVLK